MSLAPHKEAEAINAIAVDMDERAFLMPEMKNIAQLRFAAETGGVVSVEFIYAHNVNRLPPSRLTLRYEDAKDLCRRLVDAVYRAQTQNVISESAHIAITMVTNGYIFIIDDSGAQKQFYMSSAVIWRVCNALCRVVDMQSPVLSH